MKSILIKTIDYSVFDKWSCSMRESVPIFSTVVNVEKKQYFFLLICLMEYSLDENKNANAVFDIKITRPDKKVYIEKENMPVVKGQVIDPQFLLSDAVIKMCFEPEDEVGTYKILVKVKDLNNGKSQVIKDKISLIKFENKKYFKNDSQFIEWIYQYHVEPSPEKSISAFYYWINSSIFDKQNSNPPYFCFFLEIFRENKQLLSHLMDIFDSLDSKSKFATLILFRLIDHDFTKFYELLEGEDLEMRERVLNNRYDFDPFVGFLDADSVQEFLQINVSRLDMLWGTFFASGRYDCIKEISSRLEHGELVQFIEEFNKLENPTEEDRKKFIIAHISLSAFKSLQGNCKNYKQVLDYCVYLYEKEDLSGMVKSGLRQVLGTFKESNFNYNM